MEFSFKIDKWIVSVSLGICCQGNSQLSPTTESPPNWMCEVTKWQRGPFHPTTRQRRHKRHSRKPTGPCCVPRKGRSGLLEGQMGVEGVRHGRATGGEGLRQRGAEHRARGFSQPGWFLWLWMEAQSPSTQLWGILEGRQQQLQQNTCSGAGAHLLSEINEEAWLLQPLTHFYSPPPLC